MTRYLYVLSIGPIQDFIAAARRTRDLWFGSFLLSEISKAAAKCVADSGSTLIFPALDKDSPHLNPATDIESFNVANIILAEIETDPEELNQKAQQAANERWLEFAKEVRLRPDLGRIINSQIWESQVNDVIECYAAWVPRGNDYHADRKRVMRLLAGRKTTRNFHQPGNSWSVEKSSLDGARESVLENRKAIPKWLSMQLRLTDGEELCAVGITKRLGWGKVPFPSVTRIALDPWIRGVCQNPSSRQILQEIGDKCTGDTSFSTGTGKYYPDFPFDGQVLFPSRIERLLKDIEGCIQDPGMDSESHKSAERDKNFLIEIQDKVRILQKKGDDGHGFGEPDPYLAILVADGDKMGKAISSISSPDEHRKFSRELSKFASDARVIIERNRGSLVYSGGDDVLAFLPVDTCLDAARELHDTFQSLQLTEPTNIDSDRPSLSVGIAIGHKLVPLEDLLTFGRAAEHHAKEPDRNGLAVHLYTRNGGDPIKLREQWVSQPGQNVQEGQTCFSLDKRLQQWIQFHLYDLLSDKTAYDLREFAEVYKGWEKPIPAELLEKDFKRLLSRKKADRGEKEIREEDIHLLLSRAQSYEDICHLADELILSRSIAVNVQQACASSRRGDE